MGLTVSGVGIRVANLSVLGFVCTLAVIAVAFADLAVQNPVRVHLATAMFLFSVFGGDVAAVSAAFAVSASVVLVLLR